MGLDTVELAMALEEEFGLELPDLTWGRVATPGDVITYFEEALKAAGRPKSRPLIAKAVKRITIAQSGIRESRYREDAGFIEDFGMD